MLVSISSLVWRHESQWSFSFSEREGTVPPAGPSARYNNSCSRPDDRQQSVIRPLVFHQSCLCRSVVMQIRTDQTQLETNSYMCVALAPLQVFFFFFLSQGNSAKMKKFCIKNSLKYNGGEIKASQFLNSQAAHGISRTFILQRAVTIFKIIHILSITFKKGSFKINSGFQCRVLFQETSDPS